MAQKRNAVVLNATAIAKLQKLVDTGEYCSLDDAASHIIVSVLSSTHQYSPVLLNESTPKINASTSNQDSLATVLPSTAQNGSGATPQQKQLAKWLESDE